MGTRVVKTTMERKEIFEFKSEEHYVNWFYFTQKNNNYEPITKEEELYLREIYVKSLEKKSWIFKNISFNYKTSGKIYKEDILKNEVYNPLYPDLIYPTQRNYSNEFISFSKEKFVEKG